MPSHSTVTSQRRSPLLPYPKEDDISKTKKCVFLIAHKKWLYSVLVAHSTWAESFVSDGGGPRDIWSRLAS